MKLGDIAGIFSRPFIVGYFIPALIAWTTVDLLTLGEHPNRFENLSFAGQAIVLAILSGIIAALLSAGRYEIRSAFALGDFIPKRLRQRFTKKEQNRFTALKADDGKMLAERDVRFPAEFDHVGPTRFGNVTGAYQAYPATRFGLDYVVAWKRIDVLLSAREVELHALARSDVAAFLNLCVLGPLAAAAVLVERLVHPSPVAASAAVILLFSVASYRLAVRAERRLGDEQRASFDLHRLELYRQFGLRWPASPQEEKTVAQALSTVLLWPPLWTELELPPRLWQRHRPESRENA